MLVYTVTMLTSLGIAYMGMRTKAYHAGKVGWTIALAAIPLFLLAALRSGIGTDYANYVELYAVLEPVWKTYAWEPVFYLICKVLTLLQANPQWLFIVSAGIYVFFVFGSIFRESPYPLLSLFLLFGCTFFFSSLNTVRQNVGCAILLYSLRYVEQKNFLRFLICVLLASGFHYFCIVFLVVYFFAEVAITPKRAVYLFAAVMAGAGILVWGLSAVLADTRYIHHLEFAGGLSIVSVFGVAVQAAILSLATVAYKPGRKYGIYYGLQVIATCITVFGLIMPGVSRMKLMFAMPVMVLLPMAIQNIQDSRKRALLTIVIVICFCANAYIIVGWTGSYGVLPYRWIFSQG